MICPSCRAALRLQRQTPRGTLTRLATTITTAHAPRRLLTTMPPPTLTMPSRRRLSTTSHALSQPPPQSIEPDPETPSMSAAESAIAARLQSALDPSDLLVQDISGGCGSMYAIDITAAAFRGHSILKQQRMVNAALGDVIKQWHGVQIRTKVPADA